MLRHLKARLNVLTHMVAVASLLAACATPTAAPQPTTAPEATAAPAEPTTVPPTPIPLATVTSAPSPTPGAQYHEAPALADLVAAGKLPPVEERLPKNPRVMPVFEDIGTYGGTWRRGYSGIGDRNGASKLMTERIVRFYMPNPEKLELVPNWVDDVKMSDDATEFTFHIREGLRWSDGELVTTEDVKFWYEDVFQNPDLVSSPPSTLVINGEPVKIEIVDDLTFKAKFAGPYPLFLTALAVNSTGGPGLFQFGFLLPAHYLKNYLPKYVSQADLDKVVADKGVKSWTELWGDLGPIQSEWLNPDLPSIAAWVVKVPPPAEQVVFERNPYYFMIDEQGNQLPYIDKVEFSLFQDPETFNLWVVQGKIDEQARHLDSANLPLYKQNEEAGGYHVLTWRSTQMQVIFPNLNVEDPILNQLYNTSDFREALSIGVDRTEVRDIAWKGFGQPRQASPIPGTPYFDADFSKKWIDYDAAKANGLLDGLGLTQKDSDGYRLRSDGKRLSITMVYVDICTFCELVQKYWKDIGIELLPKQVDRSLFDELMQNGKADMLVWWWDRNNIIEGDPQNYLGTDNLWAPQWGKWYVSKGAEGVEPPADHPIRQIWAAWEEATSTSDPNVAKAAIQKIVSIHRDNVWVIGLVGEDPTVYMASNRMHNVPDNLVQDEAFREEGLSQAQQFWMDK